MQQHSFWPRPPGAGSKSLNINYKVNFKDFIPNFVCVPSQAKYIKYIERDFHSIAWVMPKGMGIWGAGGAQGVNNLFFRTWPCGISN